MNEKFRIFIKISLKFVSKCPTDKIGLDNGLAPNRRQAIIWTNADIIHWRIYTALGGDELNQIGPPISHKEMSRWLQTVAINVCIFPCLLCVIWQGPNDRLTFWFNLTPPYDNCKRRLCGIFNFTSIHPPRYALPVTLFYTICRLYLFTLHCISQHATYMHTVCTPACRWIFAMHRFT